ncbi:hypothetical protein [Aquisphaera insulae]|uniref:hypothetical protein n=1 Tax=Aquisphaera insulae TaxID=2712864 RepID=UPI0013ED9101|nr:hypothetical protein [Aquisphaera insulae]
MQALGVVVVCIATAVLYGILHDQVTARICLDYFTVAHPPVFATESPTWLGAGWGIVRVWRSRSTAPFEVSPAKA